MCKRALVSLKTVTFSVKLTWARMLEGARFSFRAFALQVERTYMGPITQGW